MKAFLANQDATAYLLKRFLRSTARVFLVTWLDNLLPADQLASSNHCEKTSVPVAMERCTAVFESFSSLAVIELAEMCSALVTPICLGTCVPCPLSAFGEKPAKLSSEYFKLPPVSLLRHNLDPVTTPSSAEMGGTSEGGLASDASDDEAPSSSSRAAARLGGALLPYFHSVLCSSGEESSADELEESSSDSEQDIGMDVDESRVVPSHSKEEHWAMQSSASRSDIMSSNSATLLAKSFERLLREISSLLVFQRVMKGKPQLPGKIPVVAIEDGIVWKHLQGIWRWLGGIMDTMECQLRTGEAVLSSRQQGSSGNTANKKTSGRRQLESALNDGKGFFLQYMLSVLCWRSDEHAHMPPVLDVMGMEHVAWILDGLLHFMLHSSAITRGSHPPQIGQEIKPNDEAVTFFFTRSASVSCLGMPPVSPFASIEQALPLAEWPQLLTAKASRDLLFHTSMPCLEVWPVCSLAPPSITTLLSSNLITSPRVEEGKVTVLNDDEVWGVSSNQLAASVLLGRWCMSCDLLHQAFGNHLRSDRKSVLGQLGGFRVVEKSFRRQMEQYENSGTYKDSTELLVSGITPDANMLFVVTLGAKRPYQVTLSSFGIFPPSAQKSSPLSHQLIVSLKGHFH